MDSPRLASLLSWPAIPWALVILGSAFGLAGGLWIRKTRHAVWIAVITTFVGMAAVETIIAWDAPYYFTSALTLLWLRLCIVMFPCAVLGAVVGCEIGRRLPLRRLFTGIIGLPLCLLVALHYRDTVEKAEEKMPRCMCHRQGTSFGGYYYARGINPQCPSQRRPSCLAHLKQLGLTLEMYADAHDGRLPKQDGILGLSVLTNYCTKLRKLLICPSDKSRRQAKERQPLTEDACSYVFRGGVERTRTDTNPTPLCWDKPGNHGTNGLCVLFTDVHVAFLTFEQWEKIAPKVN